MLEQISWFITGFITYIFDCYIFCKITDNKFKLKNYSIILIFFITILDCLILKINYNDEIRIIMTNICLIIILKIIYKYRLLDIIFISLFIYLIYVFSEIIFVILSTLFGLDVSIFGQNYYTTLISNIIIILFSYFQLKNNFFMNIVKNIIRWYNKKKPARIIFFVILSILLVIVLGEFIYIKKTPTNVLACSFILIAIILFLYTFFKELSYNNEIITKYYNLLNYSKTYEKVINEKSKNQHEYKNQLLLIKGMIKNKDNKIIKYIDELLDQNDSDAKHEWLNNLNKIPNGGLRGLICYNIDAAVDAGLISYVSVSDDIANDDVRNIFENNLKDLSIIIGVYLSNAIEAALECDKKFVTVDLSCIDNEIVISISNTFKKIPNISKDGNFISTKGKDHGYGLSLVKDIVEKNRLFTMASEINGIYFVQNLIIKK